MSFSDLLDDAHVALALRPRVGQEEVELVRWYGQRVHPRVILGVPQPARLGREGFGLPPPPLSFVLDGKDD